MLSLAQEPDLVLERTDSLQAEQLLQLRRLVLDQTGRTPLLQWSPVGHVGHGFLGTHSGIRYHVKNAEQVLFHSTLEPNTEMFSKVSCGVLRSNKFHLNFAEQRRNDMQPS